MLDKEKLEEMKKLSDEDFIRSAYKIILLRDADDDGLNNYLGVLKSGMSRENIIFDMRFSEEGCKKEVGISDFRIAEIELTKLLNMCDYKTFIEAAYLVTLGRIPSNLEIKHYLYDIYTNKYDQIDLVIIFRDSEEGKNFTTNIIGLEKKERSRCLRRKIYNIPVLGKLSELFWNLIHFNNMLDIYSRNTEQLLNTADEYMTNTERHIDDLERILRKLSIENKSTNSENLSANQLTTYEMLNGDK